MLLPKTPADRPAHKLPRRAAALFNQTLQRTAAPPGSRKVQVICSRLVRPTGRFRRRSLSLVVRQLRIEASGDECGTLEMGLK